jgi:hypothetical protein
VAAWTSAAQLRQDFASKAAIDAFSDALSVADGNVSLGLKKVIPLTRTVNYWAANGTTRPMTLAREMAAEKGRGEEVSIFNNTPPDANFLSNSTQAIVLRAELAAPPPSFVIRKQPNQQSTPNGAANPPWPETKQNTYAWRGG